METSTILLIVLAAIVALGVVLFQYYYKSKRKGRLSILMAFLRFVGLFGLFLLLINPKFTKNEYALEKANLIILTDNSASMSESGEEISNLITKIETANANSERFELHRYNFDGDLKQENVLPFDGKRTNVTKALAALNEVYGNSKSAILLLSDGNQTVGADYEFYGEQLQSSVYPVAIGDTTQYEDIAIGNVNSNRYAFLKNKYPIEVEVFYSGKSTVNTILTISEDGQQKYRERIQLSNSDNTKTVQTVLAANTVGVKNISISLGSIENERNTKNNQKRVAVEVIDEKTNIALISDIKHPDIGALKKAIESNEQRSVRILKPSTDLNNLEEVDIFIFYQPSPAFTSIYRYIQQKKASLFTITGEEVNSNFLNRIQKTFRINGSYPVQETFAVMNSGFSKFDISDFSIEDFPPLSNGAGIIGKGEGETLMNMKIMGAEMDSPLLFANDGENGKEVVLFGENIWKWRVQSYRNQQNFENFDEFIGKLMLYLATNSTKNRLNIDYQTLYEGNSDAKIRASYFDEAFVFDPNANLTVSFTNTENNAKTEIPMLRKGSFYEADLSDVLTGEYAFQVTVEGENRSKSGNFTMLDFDVEQQFLSTDHKKLGQLAAATNGGLFYPNQIDDLWSELATNKQYVPTQKATKNVVSLIDFRILLALIAAVLAAEWFIRKYNGLT